MVKNSLVSMATSNCFFLGGNLFQMSLISESVVPSSGVFSVKLPIADQGLGITLGGKCRKHNHFNKLQFGKHQPHFGYHRLVYKTTKMAIQ